MKIQVYATDSNLVTIGFIVKAGSYNETKDTLGIAHLTEHLVFRGTEKFNNKQVNTYIESLGGYMNAYTTYEFTKFYCTVPYDKWKQAIDFLIEIVFKNTIPEDMFDIEKNIVINELYMYQDDPQSIAVENLYKIMFNRYNQKLIGGTPESVKKITRQQVIDYRDKYYHSGNVDVIATGNIESNELEDYIKQNLHKHNKTLEFKFIKFNAPSTICSTKADISQSVLTWGVVLPPVSSELYVPYVILNNYLGGNASSVLYDKVREELGLCYTINTSIENFTDYSILTGYTALNKQNIKKVQDIIKQEFSDFHITEDVLENNKQYLIGQILMQQETTSGLNNLITTYGINYNLINKIKAVTVKQINTLKFTDIYWSIVTPEEV